MSLDARHAKAREPILKQVLHVLDVQSSDDRYLSGISDVSIRSMHSAPVVYTQVLAPVQLLSLCLHRRLAVDEGSASENSILSGQHSIWNESLRDSRVRLAGGGLSHASLEFRVGAGYAIGVIHA